ncbi:MAG: RagB/SusD family nutrient uptake outer membrane protein, partial [Bacteroidota bacterium]|nr:RagB/SusD family nutrient uptake outer membrane protein [Bacteroidota bacterium]
MNYIKKIALLIPTLLLIACHDDLDQTPIDPDSFTETNVFANADEAKGALAKLYASLALTGQQGPAGQADITGIDEGTSQYSRLLFSLNELTTDNAVVGWGDPGLPNLHAMNWGAGNDFTTGMYYRLAQEVSFTNSFIENAQLLNDNAEVEAYIAEARFLRAFAYFNLMDLFGDVPLVTVVSTDLPEQSTRSEIFNFVEGELLEIQDQLKESGANEYGRVDRV